MHRRQQPPVLFLPLHLPQKHIRLRNRPLIRIRGLLRMVLQQTRHLRHPNPIIRFDQLHQLIILIRAHLFVSLVAHHLDFVAVAAVHAFRFGEVVGGEVGFGVFLADEGFEGEGWGEVLQEFL